MTRTRKLTGIAVVAFVVACTAIAVQVERSRASVTELKVAGACAEGTFEWRWNLPGSACEATAN